MKYIVVNTYDELSNKAADLIAAQILVKPNCVLGLATGSSPVGTYQRLIADNKAGKIDFSTVTSVNLDEYVGLDGTNDQSYRYFMNDNLFNHVNIDKAKTFVPNGCAADLKAEGEAYDAMIKELGGIDLQLLGIGLDGHIGFNEPDSVFTGPTHEVKLENGCGNEGGNRSEERLFDNILFLSSVCDKKNLFSLHNGHHTHSDSLGGNVILGSKETGVCLNGGLVKVNGVSFSCECVCGLVKADVTVKTYTEKLKVDSAELLDEFVVVFSLCLEILCTAVRDVCVISVNVDFAEEVVIHKVAVALVVGAVQTHVLVQVHAGDGGEVDLARLVIGDQTLVGANGGGTGRQTQHAVGFDQNLSRNQVSGLVAQLVIGVHNNVFHHTVSFLSTMVLVAFTMQSAGYTPRRAVRG